jgi:hypothetical protein
MGKDTEYRGKKLKASRSLVIPARWLRWNDFDYEKNLICMELRKGTITLYISSLNNNTSNTRE